MPPVDLQDTPDRDGRLTAVLSFLHRGSIQFLRGKNREQGIDCPPSYLMAIAAEEGMSQDELSRKLRIHKGAIAKMSRQMEEKGYIERRPDEVDRRRYGLYLTEKGRAALPLFCEAEADLEEVITRGMSEEDVERFHELLLLSADNLIKELKNGKEGNE